MKVIEFNGVWKKFRRGEKINSLREAFPIFFKRIIQNDSGLKSNEFWALNNVDFSVEKGEILGIIGPNGAGKSTILKLLSRIMIPTKGGLKVKGRLSALIEITAGFHPDLTGRENVYLNGTILGMTKKEISNKFEQIIEFSGLKDFIDTPIKRYSSGMSARLGFSVAAHMDPDILLVDEVLSVGDMEFQAKSAQKMREMLLSGATIVFISHNLPLVQNLCKRVILLNRGEVIKEGKREEIVPYYENIVYKQQEDDLKKKISLSNINGTLKETPVIISNVIIYNEDYKTKECFDIHESISIKIEFSTKRQIEHPIFSLDIVRSDGVICCSNSTKYNNKFLPKIDGKGEINIELGKLNLAPGIYIIKLAIWDKNMIHPYVVRNTDIFRIETSDVDGDTNAVLLPIIKWRLNK